MDITNRTALLVGGTAGIGRGLAQRLAKAGSTVVVGGRHPRPEEPDGLASVAIDVTDAGSVASARDQVLRDYPDLDLVITTSGVMPTEDLRDPSHFEAAESAVQTNLLGTIRVIDAFTPHLLARGEGDIVTVSSGIAFLPFPLMPTYGATKAGIHAYSESLRAQLDGTGVRVMELVPPAVATGAMEKLNPHALALDEFLDEVMVQLEASPTPDEVVVESARSLRWAERDGTYDRLLAQRSQALSGLPGR